MNNRLSLDKECILELSVESNNKFFIKNKDALFQKDDYETLHKSLSHCSNNVYFLQGTKNHAIT